eukprot:c43961_g1_i1 orf=48-386(-)
MHAYTQQQECHVRAHTCMHTIFKYCAGVHHTIMISQHGKSSLHTQKHTPTWAHTHTYIFSLAIWQELMHALAHKYTHIKDLTIWQEILQSAHTHVHVPIHTDKFFNSQYSRS